MLPALVKLLASDLVIANIRYVNTYGLDVAHINSTYVRMVKWLVQNTLPEAVVATHDIGWFVSRRYLLDIAN